MQKYIFNMISIKKSFNDENEIYQKNISKSDETKQSLIENFFEDTRNIFEEIGIKTPTQITNELNETLFITSYLKHLKLDNNKDLTIKTINTLKNNISEQEEESESSEMVIPEVIKNNTEIKKIELFSKMKESIESVNETLKTTLPEISKIIKDKPFADLTELIKELKDSPLKTAYITALKQNEATYKEFIKTLTDFKDNKTGNKIDNQAESILNISANISAINIERFIKQFDSLSKEIQTCINNNHPNEISQKIVNRINSLDKETRDIFFSFPILVKGLEPIMSSLTIALNNFSTVTNTLNIGNGDLQKHIDALKIQIADSSIKAENSINRINESSKELVRDLDKTNQKITENITSMLASLKSEINRFLEVKTTEFKELLTTQTKKVTENFDKIQIENENLISKIKKTNDEASIFQFTLKSTMLYAIARGFPYLTMLSSIFFIMLYAQHSTKGVPENTLWLLIALAFFVNVMFEFVLSASYIPNKVKEYQNEEKERFKNIIKEALDEMNNTKKK